MCSIGKPGKVIICHPPKFQLASMIWHHDCCCNAAMLQCFMNAVGSLNSLCWKLRWSCQIKSAEACITSGCCEKRVWIDCRTHWQPDIQKSLLWFENCIPSWCTLHSKHAHCIASVRAEMGSAPSFLAAIRWVLMLLIGEIKSHPRPTCSLAWASICASLLTLSPPYMHVV
jgi:hypothetical protein